MIEADEVLGKLLLIVHPVHQLQCDAQDLVRSTRQQWKTAKAAVLQFAIGAPAARRIATLRAPTTKPVNIAVESFDDVTLTKCERAILVAAVQRHPRTSTRVQLSVVSGYSKNSSSFQNALSGLRVKGCLEPFQGDACVPTPGGIAAAGAVDTLPMGERLIRWWVAKLPRCPAELLESIYKSEPGGIKKIDLSEVSGYSAASSSFQNGLSQLRTLGLIQQRGEFFFINPEVLE